MSYSTKFRSKKFKVLRRNAVVTTFIKNLPFIREVRRNKYLYLLALPGILVLVVFGYLPLSTYVLAFKDYKQADGIFGSRSVGFDNFKFFFGGPDWLRVTVNTLYLNLLFLIVGLSFAVLLAVFINEIRNRKLKKTLQSLVFLPYFISWMVVSVMAYSLLSTDGGMINEFLKAIGLHTVNWYQESKYWPAILLFVNLWKGAGYNSIIFLSAITAIPLDIYESAEIDGVTKAQQLFYITLPMLRKVVVIMFLLGIGRVFYGDFGLIYALVGDNGMLFPTTDVIDTYAYRALRQLGNFSMSSAITLYQSFMGLITIVIFNSIAKKIEPDAKLF